MGLERSVEFLYELTAQRGGDRLEMGFERDLLRMTCEVAQRKKSFDEIWDHGRRPRARRIG